jgi:mRNA interferase RelE/StbE
MRSINLSRRAKKALTRVPEKHRRQLAERVVSLADNPRPNDSKKLHGHVTLYRIDVGEYRVVYSHANDDMVDVLLIDRRDRVYRSL